MGRALKHGQRLTLDEHRQVGEHMREIRRHTFALLHILSGKVKTAPLGAAIGTPSALSPAMDRLRCMLDSDLFDLPEARAMETRDLVRMYYGGPDLNDHP